MHRTVAGYVSLVFPMRRPFVINAYPMGAWATGTTTGAAMARIAVVKNTGPDLDKIVDTLRHFGPDFDHPVTGYPPFLKHLRDRLDADGFRWADYRISATCGGEALTEALRSYLEERFVRVRSGYGASDLTIGIGAETAFTVWLRRRLRTDQPLRAALLGPDEQRLPNSPTATYEQPLRNPRSVTNRPTATATRCDTRQTRDRAQMSTLTVLASIAHRQDEGEQTPRWQPAVGVSESPSVLAPVAYPTP